MNQYFFWNSWAKPYKWFYILLLLLFGMAASGLILLTLSGYNGVIGWELISRLEKIQLVAHTFNVSLIELPLELDNYLVFQEYYSGLIDYQPFVRYILLGVVGLFWIIFMTVLPGASRFTYYMGVVLGLVILLGLKIEQLQLFDRQDNAGFIFTFLLFFPLSYYFHGFRSVPLFRRFFLNSLLTGIFLLVVVEFAGVELPILHLASFGIPAAFIISLLFIFVVAHEIIVFFLYVVSSSGQSFGKNAPVHFAVVSLFYLISLVLVYLNNTKVIDWDLVYVNEFVLLLVSAIIGIWGFRKRSELFGTQLAFYPYGGFLYLAAALVCLSTIASAMYLADDAIVEAFANTIVYTHLGIGSMFFLYVFVNFFSLLEENIKVYKIVYQPKSMPFFTAILVGVILSTGFFWKSDSVAYNALRSGYYNAIGDMYVQIDDLFASEMYYKFGAATDGNIGFEFQNHRSNYSLASLAEQQNDNTAALYYYRRSLARKPTAYSYMNMAKLYNEEGLYFKALFALKDGLNEFPKNGYLKNNLSFLYSKTGVIDSAIFYLNSASENDLIYYTAESNILGLIAKNNLADDIGIDYDSLKASYSLSKNEAYKTNAMAILNQANYVVEQPLLPPLDSLIETYNLSHLYNSIYNTRYSADSTELSVIEDFIFNENDLIGFNEYLYQITGLAHYFSGNKSRAFELLKRIQNTSFLYTKDYSNQLGLIALASEASYLASIEFERAKTLGKEQASFNLALAHSTSGKLSKALSAWQNLSSKDSLKNRVVADKMIAVLSNSDLKKVKSEDDHFKYLFLNFKSDKIGLEDQVLLIKSIVSPILRVAILTQLSLKSMHHDIERSLIFRLLLEEENEIGSFVVDKVLIDCFLLVHEEKWSDLMVKIDFLEASGAPKIYETYFKAVALIKMNRAKEAEALLLMLTKDPFFVPGILLVSNYKSSIDNELGSYETLLNALQVNEYSIELLMAYIVSAYQVGLDKYAESALEELSLLVDNSTLEIFKQECRKLNLENEEEW